MSKKSEKPAEAPEGDSEETNLTEDAAATDAQPDDEAAPGAEDAATENEPVEEDDGTSVAEATPDEAEETLPPQDEAEAAEEAEEQEDMSVPGVVPAASEPPSPPPPAPVAQPASGGSGFGAMLLGGLVAGAIGFAAAWFMPSQEVEDTSGAEDRLSNLEVRLEELASAEAPLPFDASDIEARQGDLEERAEAIEGTLAGQLSEISGRIDALSGRVDEILARPVFEAGDTEAAMQEQIAAFEQIVSDAGAEARAELDELRAEAEAMRAEAEKLQQEAIAATEAADRRAAVAGLLAALDSGAPYEEELSALDDVPAALSDHAASGVPTLSALRQSFAPAARNALAASGGVASEESAEGDAVSRLTSFLRRQTNARSLAPQDGSSADAVLSRAESALNSGDLSQALDELQALSDAATAAMEGWLSQARTRADAVAAAQTLTED